jgi:hypothetical protein
MPIADNLINRVAGNKVISFLDGNAGYNQIFMAIEDVYKTAFHCPDFVGLFEWVVMTFDLKNAGATYQRAVNLIFHYHLGVMMEVYIDDLVIKSTNFKEHIFSLRVVFKRMRQYNLKTHPLKCAFGVSAGRFLGFIVHERGIEIDPKKVDSISNLGEPTCKWDMQKLLGKVNYLWRFISKLAGKADSILPIIHLKHDKDFRCGDEQRRAFEKIKTYLTTPPVLQAPRDNGGFKLYIATQEKVIGTVLTQDDNGQEFAVAYISRWLIDAETRYTFMEKLCLSLYYTCTKFCHYLLAGSCIVVSQHDVICDRTTSKIRGLSPKMASGDSRHSENMRTQHIKHTIP